tara:strand:- start:250 stop:435 length:186 start_codon:yes stop_codon:yes gene_type:complete
MLKYMGNYWYSQYDVICDTNHDYDEATTNYETATGNKNAYFWFGAHHEDLDIYELMDCSDD